ncbi:MAG: hypothetical protein EPN38_10240 [Rhodanobacteraceae bacterium]|nr:MAG: hypothetical protein EPN38_10240 [Rhodanobacteraceae bacterium]
MKNLPAAFREVFASPASWWVGAISFLVFLFIYLVTLPATFTGGAIGLGALRFLTPELLAWSLLMAAILALLMPMTVYLLRRGYKAHAAKGAAAGGVGAVIALVTPLLCCSPVLPVAFSVLAGFIPALAGGAGGQVQGFLATHEWLFFSIATLILLAALLKNASEVAKGACCAIPAKREHPSACACSNDVTESPANGANAVRENP